MSGTVTPIPPMWCAGCGDYAVRSALQHGLEALGAAPHDTMLVAGIGCSGTIQNTIAAGGYHALHGRVLPTATGIKLADPRLTVVALSGDGDAFAIGAGHLVHTFKRNPGITYIVMNNGTYGLTKGQPSPTSPPGYQGTVEEALDAVLLGLAIPSATFVARSFSGWAAHLTRVTTAALRHTAAGRGFAFLEVVSPCVAYNDDYPDWERRLVDLDTRNGHDPFDRAVAYATAVRLREEGKLAAGIVYAGESPSLEERKEILSPAAAAPVDPGNPLDAGSNAAAYERILEGFR